MVATFGKQIPLTTQLNANWKLDISCHLDAKLLVDSSK